EAVVHGYPIKAPMLDIHTVGAPSSEAFGRRPSAWLHASTTGRHPKPFTKADFTPAHFQRSSVGMGPELHRLSVDDATAWVDRATSPLPTESVSLFAACARVLADGICAVQPIPLADCEPRRGSGTPWKRTASTSYWSLGEPGRGPIGRLFPNPARQFLTR